MKGFVGQVGAHRRGHVIKPVGLLHNGTFTSSSPPHQKILSSFLLMFLQSSLQNQASKTMADGISIFK